MDDTVAWGDDAEVAESFLTPLEEGEALTVPVELNLFVAVLGVRSTSNIDLNRVINDKVSLTKWVDFVGISSELRHSCAHGGEIHDSGHAGEVLEEHSCGLEWDLNGVFGCSFPVENCLNISSCK